MHQYINAPYRDLASIASDSAAAYGSAVPFPSASFKNFFDPDLLDRVVAEFPDLSRTDATRFDNPQEKKLAGKGEYPFGPETRKFMHFLNSQPFLEFLQRLTGIRETLIGDPYFTGGGLHEIKRGGLLKIHADFNKHPTLRLDRRINVLVYLNKDWKEEYGGHFELWDRNMQRCEKRVLPEFNTLAVFSTTDFSFHGHPDPLNCPEGRSRRSLALYYYSNGRPAEEVASGLEEHSTLFRARGGLDADIEPAREPRFAVKRIIKELLPPIITKALRASQR